MDPQHDIAALNIALITEATLVPHLALPDAGPTRNAFPPPYPPSSLSQASLASAPAKRYHPYDQSGRTGGKGQYTQWVHCESIVGSETICLAHTQQVSGEHFYKVPTNSPSPNPGGKWWAHLKSTHQFAQRNTQQVSIGCFQKVPINLPGSYPAGKWWALLQSTQHKIQWVLFERTHFVLSQSVQNVPRGYFVKEPFELFHNVPSGFFVKYPQ